MVVCQLSSSPTVRSITSQAISMTQATNTVLLEADDWGLSLPPDDADADADADAPRVFLHPDTSASLILSPPEPEVDLLRLRAARSKASPRSRRDAREAVVKTGGVGAGEEEVPRAKMERQSSGVQRVSSEDAKEGDRWTRLFRVHCGKGGLEVRWSKDPSTVRSPFAPSPSPVPPHLTHVRYELLQQLKRVQPPRLSPPPGLQCLLFPAPLAPPLLSTPSASTLHAPSSPHTNGTPSPLSKPPKPSKEDRRRDDERRKERDKEVAAIDATLAALAARRIGYYRPVAQGKRKGEEEDEDEVGEEGARRAGPAWAGGEVEVPLFFIPLQPPPTPSPAGGGKKGGKAVSADNGFVLTSLRAVQVEGGEVVKDLRIGPGSGGVLEVPDGPVVGGGEGVRLVFRVRELADGEVGVGEGGGEEGDGEEAEEEGKEEVEEDEEGGKRGRGRVSTVSFLLPSTPLVSYLQAYVLYMQSTLTLQHALHCLTSSSSSLTTATPYRHALLGWTMLLKSFIGPLVFGPLRLPLYTHQVKQLLARVQQMQLPRGIQLHSLKLLQFHLPRPELTEEGEEGEEDFIPSLSLRSFKGHPDHEYTFDVSWTCPSFLVRVEITGKKVVSFKLELEMRGVEVSGCVLLRSTPYAPEQLAVQFAEIPQLAFGVSSQVVVGSVRLPFQHSIERLLTQQIQSVLTQQLSERACAPRWVSVYFAKSAVSLLLDRWWSIAKFPFKFDGRDDEEMMGLALVVTTQAEAVLLETLREMRKSREEMEGFMTRPLYGEEVGEEWQAKEKLRLMEKEAEREREEAEEGRGKRKGKKKASGGVVLDSERNGGGQRKKDRDVAVEDVVTPSKVKKSKSKG